MFIKSICCLAGMVSKHTHIRNIQSKYIKVQADYIKIVYNVVCFFFTLNTNEKKKNIMEQRKLICD